MYCQRMYSLNLTSRFVMSKIMTIIITLWFSVYDRQTMTKDLKFLYFCKLSVSDLVYQFDWTMFHGKFELVLTRFVTNKYSLSYNYSNKLGIQFQFIIKVKKKLSLSQF